MNDLELELQIEAGTLIKALQQNTSFNRLVQIIGTEELGVKAQDLLLGSKDTTKQRILEDISWRNELRSYLSSVEGKTAYNKDLLTTRKRNRERSRQD